MGQLSDLKRLVAAEKRTAEKQGAVLPHEVEDVDAAEDESPAEEENGAGA